MSRATVLFSLGLCLSFISSVSAQTFTACQPLNSTCPPDLALGVKNYTADFTQALDPTIWNTTNGNIVTNSGGANFVINKRLESPTIQSTFYIFFGTVEIHMKAASGQGIISSIVLESDDLDEIDWEWMGGNQTSGETNYFGKGNQTDFTRATYYPINAPMTEYHNYTLDWSPAQIQWILDGNVIRTLKYADANGGATFPQTPMTVRLGIWAGGDASQPKGTIEWAGGLTDYSKAPFTMSVQSAKISDASTGKTYTYSDHSGDFKSIKAATGNSTVATTIAAGPAPPTPTPLTMAQKWAAMSNTEHIGIIAGGSAGVALLAGLLGLCCFQQRRRGRKDRAEQEKRLEEQRIADAAYDGLSAKDQDKLTTGIHTPAEWNNEHAGLFNPKAPNNLSVDTFESNSLLKDGSANQPLTPVAAPVYQNSGFGSKGYSPSTATSPVYHGSGYASQTRSPASPVGSAHNFNFNNNSSSRGLTGPGQGYASPSRGLTSPAPGYSSPNRGPTSPGPGYYGAPARSDSSYSRGHPGNAFPSGAGGVHPGNNF